MNDFRYALRMLLKSPGFTALAVLTLALGIGANTAIFSAVNAILLRPLPYPQPDRLVDICEKTRQEGASVVAYPDFLDWQQQNQVFLDVAALQWASFNLSGTRAPERVQAMRITANFFRTLGVKPLLGRDFLPAEDKPGGDPVVLLGYRLWQSRFGTDPALVGKTVWLNGAAYLVVGILPPRALAYEEASLFVPLGPTTPGLMNRGTRNSLYVKARLKPRVTLAQAQAEMEVIGQRLEQRYPQTNTGRRPELLTPHRGESFRPILGMLMGATGFVLLIACANLANLMLARALHRSRETAIRLALGASRAAVLRLLAIESTSLALAGGVAGLTFGQWGCQALNATVPHLEEFALGGLTIDGRVLAFTMVLSLLTALVFGLAPAWRVARPDLNGTLKEGTKSSVGSVRHRVQNTLVVAQVALACILLVGTGLMLRSVYRLMTANPGFDARNVLCAKLDLGAKGSAHSSTPAFYTELLDRVRQLPGVVSVATAFPMPLDSHSGNFNPYYIEGRALPAPGEEPETDVLSVSPDYFHTLGIVVVKGRAFSRADLTGPARTAIINETMARRCWPGEDPVGKRLAFNASAKPEAWNTIVGVVADSRRRSIDEPAQTAVYIPSLAGNGLIVRTGSNPAALVSAVRAQVQALDKDQPLYDVKTLQEALAESVLGPRITAALLGVFAGLALVLTSVGLYGLISYSVAQQTHEIGVRMALGAERGQVARQVVRAGLLLALLGIVAGLAGACGLTRFLAGLLYGVKPLDLATFVSVSIVLLLVALLACYLPARRAASIDPMEALRYE